MSKEAMKLSFEALNLAMENLRPHGDNCFLHDDGEYNRCFCGKDSLVNHLESVFEALEEALKQDQGEPVIDKSAAIRIATVLRWEPKRKPMTFEQADDVALDVIGVSMFDKEQAETAHLLIRATEAAHGIKE